MNTPVNFELAKLLKEKGFDEPIHQYYRNEDIVRLSSSNNMNQHGDGFVSAPTSAQVVMWLYEKHGVWVRVTPIPYSDNLTHWRWEHMSTNYSTRNFKWKKEQDYMSPTEAYEAAIEYTLKNLIQ